MPPRDQELQPALTEPARRPRENSLINLDLLPSMREGPPPQGGGLALPRSLLSSSLLTQSHCCRKPPAMSHPPSVKWAQGVTENILRKPWGAELALHIHSFISPHKCQFPFHMQSCSMSKVVWPLSEGHSQVSCSHFAPLAFPAYFLPPSQPAN